MERSTSARHRVSEPRRRTVPPPDDARRRALARLYARRGAVSNLIGALERYQQEQSRLSAKRAAITAAEMLSLP